MQIIEVTELAGVRSAIIPFRHTESPLRFVLFPMIHLAEQSFYDDVAERLRSMQLVLTEGVQSTKSIDGTYRDLEGNERFGLVVQNLDYDAIGVPVHCPDMPGEEFDDRWDDLPLSSRLAFGLLRPVFSAVIGMFGSRRALASGLEEDVDLPDPDVGFELWESIDDLIVDQRDRLLVNAIRTTHEQWQGDDVDVAIVWGAGHMTAVVNALWALGYRPDAGEWVTVFRLDEPARR